MTTKAKAKKPTMVIVFLLTLFVVPMLVARYMFQHRVLIGASQINNGNLITPPIAITELNLYDDQGRPITAKTFQGHWTLLFNDGNQCGKYCKAMLYNIRQIRIATGKDQERVERALITANKSLDKNLQALLSHQYKGTEVIIRSDDISHLAQNMPQLQPNRLYISDPMGNIMMSYNDQSEPMAVLKDMQRLLKVSQIG